MQKLNKSQLEYVRDNVSPHVQNTVAMEELLELTRVIAKLNRYYFSEDLIELPSSEEIVDAVADAVSVIQQFCYNNNVNEDRISYVLEKKFTDFVSTLTTKNNVGGGGCTYV